MIISQIIFAILLIGASTLFTINAKKIIRNIKIGKAIDRFDNASKRWATMAIVALGQSKMVVRPIAGILHIFVYVGFIIINIEMIEIVIDGLFGLHRSLSFMGNFYNFLIACFEILALLVIIAVIAFYIRRNTLKIKRFNMPELENWPKKDANLILIIEIFLMSAFLLMNAADQGLQNLASEHYHIAGTFPISQFLTPLLGNNESTLIFLERFAWWFHIIGVLAFLNYLPISKHLHIILGFPNTYFSKLSPKGQFTNPQSITEQVNSFLDDTIPVPEMPEKFGAKDVMDLTWKSLLEAYTCTECGRCTSECPASQTGKLLSPRKIMMSTRDRLEEVGKNIDINRGVFIDDGKSLLHDYITKEELLACTTCNACVEACPINIDPVSIIIDLRRFLVMDESNMPAPWMGMLTNIENNQAPWQFSPADRLNWANE